VRSEHAIGRLGHCRTAPRPPADARGDEQRDTRLAGRVTDRLQGSAGDRRSADRRAGPLGAGSDRRQVMRCQTGTAALGPQRTCGFAAAAKPARWRQCGQRVKFEITESR
jgi:hypothetical protein